MLRAMTLVLGLLPVIVSAEILNCEQQQTVCDSQCQITNIGDENGLTTCKTRCLGKRAACAVKKGTETAKEAWENSEELRKTLGDKAKTFWEGFNEN
ncbi:hypothetical protein M3P05_03890 [Sansalvadorimonas sp. 2012CJ34-2]|uniref:Uncharacterized protein n=1 Tax=Parendozoicomonas callyspongiae TaxID=2942213 RepID=A0ABT0PEW9_9GAMM|nr:hypothetical protein [Sansalvadorimonas sp. 2012CJ34-2]MCL6269083.1 hypothetical protein [Sansalvadorimonas sp. 2012CJ34-2]